MSDSAGLREVAWQFGAACEACGVEYCLGGSVASSLQGQARSTNDIDFIVRLDEHRVDALQSALGADFLVDEVALKDAMRLRRSWNVFHLPTMLRIDLFAMGTGAFDAEELRRRRAVEISPGKVLFVKSPEDTVLRKLLWFQLGDEAQSQQLRDVIEVLRVQQGHLDEAYLDRWAKTLGVEVLLGRARAAVTRGGGP